MVVKPPTLPISTSKKSIDSLGETFGKRSSTTLGAAPPSTRDGEHSFRAHTSIGTNASNTSRMSTMMATLQPKKESKRDDSKSKQLYYERGSSRTSNFKTRERSSSEQKMATTTKESATRQPIFGQRKSSAAGHSTTSSQNSNEIAAVKTKMMATLQANQEKQSRPNMRPFTEMTQPGSSSQRANSRTLPTSQAR